MTRKFDALDTSQVFVWWFWCSALRGWSWFWIKKCYRNELVMKYFRISQIKYKKYEWSQDKYHNNTAWTKTRNAASQNLQLVLTPMVKLAMQCRLSHFGPWCRSTCEVKIIIWIIASQCKNYYFFSYCVKSNQFRLFYFPVFSVFFFAASSGKHLAMNWSSGLRNWILHLMLIPFGPSL